METPSTPPVVVAPPPLDLALRRSFDFFTHEHLRIADLDVNQHVNNVAILSLFENVRNRYIQEGRTPLVRDEHQTYMLVHLDVDYKSELHYPGVVDAACTVLELRRTSVVFGQAVFAGERVAAVGHAIVVSVDRISKRGRPFDAQALARFDLPKR